MELGRQFKQPHQMSPDEFAAHPAAVFHSTYLPDEEVFNLEKRDPSPASGLGRVNITNGWGEKDFLDPVKKIHLGTFQAALERGFNSNEDKNKKLTIHTFWQTPKIPGATAKERLTDYFDVNREHNKDDVANPENVAHYIPGGHYYENQNEDLFSASFATDEPTNHLSSQADYVKAALNSGVPESEIHPRTLAQYKAGTLGKMRMTSDTAELMRSHPYKLGPYTEAGPKWYYIDSDKPAPWKPEDIYE
jgi:hypothetical protein